MLILVEMTKHDSTLRSQAHLQDASANAKTKNYKRACLPKCTADRKDAAKMKENNEKNEQRNANKGYMQ